MSPNISLLTVLLSALVYQATAVGKIVWSVNAGGESHTDSFGIFYAQDNLRTGTDSDFGKSLIIQRVTPQDMILYQTERYHTATFGYDIPIKEDGKYVLVLKFSEVWFAAPQQKVFDVVVNGEHTIVSDLDIFGRVGRGVAHDEIIPFEIANDVLKINSESSGFDGTLSVEFVKGTLDNPKVNAIYIMKGDVDDVPKLQPLKNDDEEEELEDFDETEELTAEEKAMLERRRAMKQRQKREQPVKESQRRTHSSGKLAVDPFETDDSYMSSTFLPIAAAVVAFLPIIVCLWRL